MVSSRSPCILEAALANIHDIEVPMIAAINGLLTVHSEYALLCDIVSCRGKSTADGHL